MFALVLSVLLGSASYLKVMLMWGCEKNAPSAGAIHMVDPDTEGA